MADDRPQPSPNTVSPATPVEVAESPWEDPIDGLLSGAYRYRARLYPDLPKDHLVVYIRGAGGDPTAEYRADRAVCGLEIITDPKPVRMAETCETCLHGVGRAFEAARLAMAAAHGPGELG